MNPRDRLLSRFRSGDADANGDNLSTATSNTAVVSLEDRAFLPAGVDPGDPLPGRHVVFSVVSMALMMGSLDATIVATALHTIGHDLHSTINWTAWTITAYSIGRLMSVPMMGKIGDKYGRRRVFLWSIALFTFTSLCCGVATNIYELVALRFFQSIGGGAFMPSATGIVAEQFGRNRDRAVALFNSVIPVGGILGPIFGGLFVTYWSWRGIFLVNVPIGIVLIILGHRVIPETRRKNAAPTDFLGIAMFGGLLFSLIFGVTMLGNGHTEPTDAIFLVPEIIGVVLIALFVRHIRTAADPLLPPNFFVGKGFLAVNTINFMFGAGAMGFSALVPLYAQDRYNIAVLSSGTLLTARGFGAISIAGLSALAIRRIGVRPLMAVGFTITGASLLLLTLPPPMGMSPYEWLAIASAITGIGFGLSTPATSNAGLQLAPDQVGAISGLRGMFRFSGAIIAVSITAAILARSPHPGIAEGHVFFVFSLMVFATVPIVYLIKDKRGRW